MILSRSVTASLALALALAGLASGMKVRGQGFLGGSGPARTGTLEVSAVDLAGQPVEGFQVVTDPMKIRKPSGIRFRAGFWQAMLVKPQPDGATLFSRVFPLRIRAGINIRMQNLRMQTGVTVRGRLSSRVPRPIERGVVITASCPLPREPGDRTALTWHDWTTIDADGSFELKSVPFHGEIQVIAICDGWISKTTVPYEGCVGGQMFPVSKRMPELSIEMEQTGSIELVLRTPDGEKLTDGMVSARPLQYFVQHARAVPLGDGWRTIDFFNHADVRPGKPVRFDGKIPYDVYPCRFVGVNDGVAVINGVPLGRNEEYFLHHNEYAFTSAGLGTLRFKLDGIERKRVELVVEEPAGL